LSTSKTLILYIDTTYKIKKNSQIKKRYTFSRYEYAKKELGYKLFKKYYNLRILNIPIIINDKNKVEIFGNKFMTTLFNFLLYFNHNIRLLTWFSSRTRNKFPPYFFTYFFPNNILLIHFIIRF